MMTTTEAAMLWTLIGGVLMLGGIAVGRRTRARVKPETPSTGRPQIPPQPPQPLLGVAFRGRRCDGSLSSLIQQPQPKMIRMRSNIGGRIEYQQRGFVVDASGAFCGMTDWGPWEQIDAVKGDESDSKWDT